MPIYRVDILKKYLFPKKKIFKFIPEGVAWLEISKYHKVELLNRPMRYYYENDKGLMSINKKFTKNLEGKILLNRKLEFFIERYFLNNIILVTNILVHKAVLALLINRNFFQIEKFSIFIRIFYFILIPLSLIKFFIIKLKK